MKFIKAENGNRIEMEICDESTIEDVLEEFANFLRACGYVIDYKQVLDLVDVDE